jgi:hypothetical protein
MKKVRIDDRNGNLRLRWNDGKVRTMAIGVKNSHVGRKYADTWLKDLRNILATGLQQKSCLPGQIWLSMLLHQHHRFDPTVETSLLF